MVAASTSTTRFSWKGHSALVWNTRRSRHMSQDELNEITIRVSRDVFNGLSSHGYYGLEQEVGHAIKLGHAYGVKEATAKVDAAEKLLMEAEKFITKTLGKDNWFSKKHDEYKHL